MTASPSVTPSDPFVPLVDMSAWWDGNPGAREAVAAEVDAALSRAGFLVLAGHGISDSLVEMTREAGRAFFSAPHEVKARIETHFGGRGWISHGREAHAFAGEKADPARPDLKEGFTFGSQARTGDPQVDATWFPPDVWPAEVPELRAACEPYAVAVRGLYRALLEVCALALGLPTGWFAERTEASPWAFTFNRYLPLAEAGTPQPGQLRIGAHTDWGVLTLLARDPGHAGLQVQRPDGDWEDAPLVPATFTVNVGDLLARWTGDRWRSTRHRVVPPPPGSPAVEQISVVGFFEADVDAVVAPLPPPVGLPSDLPAVTAGDYWLARRDGSTAA